LAKFDLKSYARAGAEARARELVSELTAIYKAFPEVRRVTSGRGSEVGNGRTARRKRKPMTAAQKKAVGERMKKYWAARRKQEK
jgi:hypothetical protein